MDPYGVIIIIPAGTSIHSPVPWESVLTGDNIEVSFMKPVCCCRHDSSISVAVPYILIFASGRHILSSF